MDAEIAKLILQAGSATSALFALWLYHHSVQKLFEIISKQREDSENLISACLKLADDRETLKSIHLKTLEILSGYDYRKITIAGENRTPGQGN